MYTTAAGGQPTRSLQVARVGLRARGRAFTARGTRGLRLPVQAKPAAAGTACHPGIMLAAD